MTGDTHILKRHFLTSTSAASLNQKRESSLKTGVSATSLALPQNPSSGRENRHTWRTHFVFNFQWAWRFKLGILAQHHQQCSIFTSLLSLIAASVKFLLSLSKVLLCSSRIFHSSLRFCFSCSMWQLLIIDVLSSSHWELSCCCKKTHNGQGFDKRSGNYGNSELKYR